jgi:hypothetical protein
MGRWQRYAAGGALALSGMVVGGILALSAGASAEPTPAPSASSSAPAYGPAAGDSPGTGTGECRGGRGGPGGPRNGETALTGEVADKVKAAVLAKYPGATVHRLETDADGVYEAHIMTAGGERLTVEVNKEYAVTGTEQRPPRR